MKFGSQGENGRESGCRALVPLAGRETDRGYVRVLSSAPFVVQLAASATGLAAYRAKRRAEPADGSDSYRASAARIAAAPPLGGRLNYCA